MGEHFNPRKVTEARFRYDNDPHAREVLAALGSIGGRVAAEKKKAAQQAEEDMAALRDEAFGEIAAERAIQDRLAEEKRAEDELRASNEDTIPLDTYDQ